jgi:hypothetical protein
MLVSSWSSCLGESPKLSERLGSVRRTFPLGLNFFQNHLLGAWASSKTTFSGQSSVASTTTKTFSLGANYLLFLEQNFLPPKPPPELLPLWSRLPHIFKFQHWYVLLIVRCSSLTLSVCSGSVLKKKPSFTSTLKTSSRPKSNVSFK